MNGAAVECLLFVTGEPLPLEEIAKALCMDPSDAAEEVELLRARLRETDSGLHVVNIAGGYQLATRAEHAEAVGRLLARSVRKLSRAALETIAIVAYRQPITQPEIEAVRGVSVSGVLGTLVERGLVADVGRRATAGRPILYATTPEFLHYFGIGDIAELPPLEDALDPTPSLPLPA